MNSVVGREGGEVALVNISMDEEDVAISTWNLEGGAIKTWSLVTTNTPSLEVIE